MRPITRLQTANTRWEGFIHLPGAAGKISTTETNGGHMQTIGSMLKARHENGFTLIELLIVVLIIGILASIVVPKFGRTKENAYMASMKSDLRNLVTAQETYFSDNTTYTSDMSAAGLNINASAGVSVTVTITAGPPVGFSATSGHIGTTETCAVFIASPPVAPAVSEGEPRCTT